MLLEVAPRGFEEFRPGEHHVDRRRQPSAERRLSKPRGATSGSIPARLISRAAMDDRKMNPSLPPLRSGSNPLGVHHLGALIRESGALWPLVP